MSFFDPPKFPEPFKPEPLWQMNTCPTCQNDLVCHDQGECLRPTPETERLRWQLIDRYGTGTFEEVLPKLAAMERQRNKAREQLASEKSTRNVLIAKGVETERQLAEAREENERLREAVKEARDCILQLLDNGHDDGCDWINYAKAPCTCGVDDGRIVLSKLQPFLTP